MIKILSLSFAFFLIFALSGCQSATETKTENSNTSDNADQSSKTPNTPVKSEQTIPVDVAKLANKSIAEFDSIFEKMAEGKTVEPIGEYRLYKIAGLSKGLAVRFYDGRAKSFNLILDKPASTSKEALRRSFGIDVDSFAPVKDAKEPLSERYQGTFGGVKFKKVSAKRAGNGQGFVFVLAEVGE
jgi:hypothetical protein